MSVTLTQQWRALEILKNKNLIFFLTSGICNCEITMKFCHCIKEKRD
jgi:hypothetical protein